jgi:signal transduction histidine kinase
LRLYKDNGTGIAEAEQAKIFTPNFTTKTGGMGLGLAMVKSIIEQAGGAVWFCFKTKRRFYILCFIT